MKQIKLILLVYLLVQPRTPLVAEETDLFIIFQAGFNGCSKDRLEDPKGADIYKPLHKSLRLLNQNNINFDYSIACFPFELLPKTMKYYLNKKKTKLYESNLSDYRNALKAAIYKSKAKKVLIVGHSHGAWLGMHQILDDDFPVSKISLIGVDPISLKNCTFGVFFRSMIRNKLPFFEKNKPAYSLLEI